MWQPRRDLGTPRLAGNANGSNGLHFSDSRFPPIQSFRLRWRRKSVRRRRWSAGGIVLARTVCGRRVGGINMAKGAAGTRVIMPGAGVKAPPCYGRHAGPPWMMNSTVEGAAVYNHDAHVTGREECVMSCWRPPVDRHKSPTLPSSLFRRYTRQKHIKSNVGALASPMDTQQALWSY